ncbi:ABC transporter [Halorubrum coriense DSM 10284]|uniref:ABC transporter n=1 Tax=Halorubrum coriense DSM 10284 TaxID=1227466 RepID=M0EC16_9EURY|nr:ABC transporter [Halorubrum coriense DSM 10284]
MSDEVGVVFEEADRRLFDAETGEDVLRTDEAIAAAIA